MLPIMGLRRKFGAIGRNHRRVADRRTIIRRMYSLREPLPSDIVAHAAGPFGGYRRFPVFSAPWLLGRCAIFIPLTGWHGCAGSVLVGLEFHDTGLGWQTAAVSVPDLDQSSASAAPALATLRPASPAARTADRNGGDTAGHRRQLLGASTWQSCTHSAAVVPRYMALFPGFNPSTWPHPSLLFMLTTRGAPVPPLRLLGGGVALIAFYREQHWWQILAACARTRRGEPEKAEVGSAAHGAAGAGRTTLPVQYPGLGAQPDPPGSRRAPRPPSRRWSITCGSRCRSCGRTSAMRTRRWPSSWRSAAAT